MSKDDRGESSIVPSEEEQILGALKVLRTLDPVLFAQDKLEERYPEIVAMREFASTEAIEEGLRTGSVFFCTKTAHSAPAAGLDGPWTVGGYKKDAGWRRLLAVNDDDNERAFALGDMQNCLGKAVFTTEEAAEAYAQQCMDAYLQDPKWQQACELERWLMETRYLQYLQFERKIANTIPRVKC